MFFISPMRSAPAIFGKKMFRLHVAKEDAGRGESLRRITGRCKMGKRLDWGAGNDLA
jgi:hypothetical protein